MAKLTIQNRYGIAPNELLNNPDISLKAKGMFVFIQSKPEGWSFSVERICLQTKDAKDSVKSALKELEDVGYLKRNSAKNEDGTWGGYDYLLSDSPLTENPLTVKPLPENHVTLSNKDSSKKDIVKKKTARTSKYSSIKYLEDIPKVDMKEFTDRFIASEKEIKSKGEDLKLYCEGKGKVYKNYRSFLLNSLKKDFKERDSSEVSSKYARL